jgi:hypothetical protein
MAGPRGRAVWEIRVDRIDAETVGSYPVYSMDICARVFTIIITVIHLSPYHWHYIV